MRAVHHLPQLDVAEAEKKSSERNRLKRSESSTPCSWPRGTSLRGDQRRQRLRERVPVGIAVLRGCLASAAG